MAIVLTRSQREQANAPRRAAYKRQVIDHTRRKIVFSSATSEADFEAVADLIFEKVDRFLSLHPRATYDSYVLMMLVYFLRGIEATEGADMQATLQNPRIGINTRIRISYELCKVFMKEGL